MPWLKTELVIINQLLSEFKSCIEQSKQKDKWKFEMRKSVHINSKNCFRGGNKKCDWSLKWITWKYLCRIDYLLQTIELKFIKSTYYTYSVRSIASRFILILLIRLWNTFLPLLVNIHYLQWEPIIIVLWVLDMDQFASNIVLTESYEKNQNPGSQPQESSWTGT